MKSEEIHKKIKKEIIKIFNKNNIKCEDLDKDGKAKLKVKTPDIKLAELNTLIELKIIMPTQNDMKLQKKHKFLSVYWPKEKQTSFKNHLKDSRKKFREFKDFKSLVIFFDANLMDRQHIKDLILGNEIYRINNDNKLNREIEEKEIRPDKNKEIGAVGQFYLDTKKFLIIHNTFANEERKLSQTIGSTLKAKEMKIKYNDLNQPIIVEK